MDHYGFVLIIVDRLKYVHCPTHSVCTHSDVILEIDSKAAHLSCFIDAEKGYFQITLDEASQHITVFITPWGQYK
jgi:hypothetical protein